MTNLIPPSAKKSLKREYLTRVYTVGAILMTVALGTATVLMVPVYVLIDGQLAALQYETEQVEQSEDRFVSEELEIKDSNKLSSQLSIISELVPPTDIIRAIEQSQPNDVSVHTYSLAVGEGVRTVQIQGLAATANSLVQFKTAVERVPMFAEATVPYSDLADEVDLQFAMTIDMITNE